MDSSPSLEGLPIEIFVKLIRPLVEDDRHSLINFIVAHPRLFFSTSFNIAEFDASKFVKYIRDPTAFLPDPVPLITTAIEYEATPLWLLRRLVIALEKFSPGAINGIYDAPHIVEPPLHTAVRIGRIEAVHVLLGFPSINPNVRYWHGRYTPEGHAVCTQRGYVHLPPCRPETVLPRCMGAAAYAVESFHVNIGTDLSKRIEQCAIALTAAGWVPQSITAHAIDISITKGIEYGMCDYVIAVLNRMFEEPPAVISGTASYNFKSLLASAVRNPASTKIVQYILTLCIKFGVFPLVAEQDLPANVLRVALANDSTQSAILILEYMQEHLLKHVAWQPHSYVATLLGIDMLIKAALRDVNFPYFVEHMKFLGLALNSTIAEGDKKQYKQILDLTINKAMNSTIIHDTGSRRHAIYLVQHWGQDTPTVLRDAIRRGDAAVVDAIASKWKGRGESLDQNLPRLKYKDVPEPALRSCFRDSMLMGIVILLNAGADPRTVSPQDWKHLGMTINKDTRELTELEFYQRYLMFGSFESEGQYFQEGVTGIARVHPFVRLILRIAETYGGD
ncbi:hypothetical protein F4776DRAFT_297699 [Hypoxylon sp. NC0597]|nr:hypothetical protein F4776DRAFT_297699 [Hypoxylon sp. NC0597]